MGKKLRKGKPWMPGYRYGALLSPVALNLIVKNVETSVAFYENVLQAMVVYYDVDFAAVRLNGIDIMLHADHTHDEHAWHPQLAASETRGLGAQFRVLGLDPDGVHERAQANQAQVIAAPADKGHGWREILVRDPDGYEWAVGVLIDPAKGPFRPSED